MSYESMSAYVACNSRYITFVLKGTNQTVNYAYCLDRGLSPQLIGLTKGESVYRTGYDNLSQVAKWYAEDPELIKGSGYPEGTCLIYSIHDTSGEN